MGEPRSTPDLEDREPGVDKEKTAMDELIFDRWAKAQKVERPFAALADMPQECRDEVANLLKIDLTGDNWRKEAALVLLDINVRCDGADIPVSLRAPAEAACLIGVDLKGIQARAHSTWRTINPFATNYSWLEILEAVANEVGIYLSESEQETAAASRFAREEAYEAAITERAAEQAWEQMAEGPDERPDEGPSIEAILADCPGLVAQFERAGFGPYAMRILLSRVRKQLVKKGFGAYVDAVKLAARLNRNLGTKIAMKSAAKSMKWFLRTTNVLLWAWLAKDVLDWLFGPSRWRLVPVVSLVHTDWCLMRLEENG
ncbi:hypothetical protein D6833_04795 [Candidatus Parcubacteria bacterium]|nr:MAG: hypothetical protein D6833_04795 [Candidatus Parcubacteria bacterium]